MPENPVIQVIVQHGEYDCCVAALAMYLGRTYEDVLAAAATLHLDPKVHRRGMWTPQIEKIAEAFGVPLCRHRYRKWDFEIAEGILGMSTKDLSLAHVVVLRAGLVFDSRDGTVWEPDVYLASKHYIPRVLLSRRGKT